MLHFIFGRAASGKTRRIFEELIRCAKNDVKTVLLVPEQYSFETEKAVLQRLGDRAASRVSVMTFTRLCDEIDRVTGGICGKTVSDADKRILMQRAIRAAAPDLKLWSRYTHSAGFAATMLDSIEEFKLHAITAELLKNAAEQTENSALSSKLHDTALIYEQYGLLLNERFLDPSDRLTILADKLLRSRFFEGKTVFVDSFKSFTGQQEQILDRMIAQSDDIWFALTNDPALRSFGIFENVRITAEHIRHIAASHHVSVADDEFLTGSHYRSEALSAVESLLAGDPAQSAENGESVTVCAAASVYDEAEFAARTIRRLVRENPDYRYRDFVLIARDTAPYEEAVAAACEKNGVSCFIDKRVPLAAFPPAVAVLAALPQGSIRTEQILRFHKSGISVLTNDEIATLENYAYLWNVNGSLWEREWTMDPDGMVSGEEVTDRKKETLAKLNELRRRAVDPLLTFRNVFQGNARDLTRAVMDLLTECHASEAFSALADELNANGKPERADALRQSWDLMITVLNGLVNCFGNGENIRDEYIEAFRTAVSLANIGLIPQMLDEVTFGAANRIRPSRPRVAFILGANQGVFPALPSTAGLFGVADREAMGQLGIELPDHAIHSVIDEEFLVYSNLCCATDRLYLCYSAIDSAGNELEPSPFVRKIVDAINVCKMTEPGYTSEDPLPETTDSAISDFSRLVRIDPTRAAQIRAALSEDPVISERINRIEMSEFPEDQSLTPETARHLFGENIMMSASKLDNYFRCKFQYFCKYGMRVSALQPANFDVLQRGTLIHYVMEYLIRKHGKGLALLDSGQISDNVDEAIDDYLAKILGFDSVVDAHLKFLISNIARSLKEIAAHLAAELAQSEFEPKKCELKFGLEGVPPVEFPFDGGSILLCGSVDRVDEWNGYVRIIDYKSGHKDFCLPDVVFGQNIQMLLYLYIVTKYTDYSSDLPAGIFYMPVKRDMNENGLAMNGLMAEDEELLYAMERDNGGEFIPQRRITKSGALDQRCEHSFVPQSGFDTIFKHIEKLLSRAGTELLNGDISVNPRNGVSSGSCDYCDFAPICGRKDTVKPKIKKVSNAEVLQIMEEGSSNE